MGWRQQYFDVTDCYLDFMGHFDTHGNDNLNFKTPTISIYM